MKMKPRNTVLSPKAYVYKRYTNVDTAYSKDILYRTYDNFMWVYSDVLKAFVQVDDDRGKSIFDVHQDTVLSIDDTFMRYYGSKWHEVDPTPLYYRVGKATIGKYQTNRYLYHCSLDYVKKGSYNESVTQIIKGARAIVSTINIQYFNDEANLSTDDLVVVEGKLYSVDGIDVDHKHQPKDYKIYSATLNIIL